MKQYKRLTNQKWSEDIDLTQELGYSYIYKRLYDLEDEIEAGTLIEIPCKVGDNAVAIIDTLCYPNAIYNVKLKDLAYIVEDENGDVTFQHITRIFGTEAEAEKRLEEIRSANENEN